MCVSREQRQDYEATEPDELYDVSSGDMARLLLLLLCFALMAACLI